MGLEENEFTPNYLILKPEEATLVDAFVFILPSGSKRIKKLIDCPDGKEETYTNFKARWTIFVSILFQKSLLAIAALSVLRTFRSTIRRLFFKSRAEEVYTVADCAAPAFGPETHIAAAPAFGPLRKKYSAAPAYRSEVRCKEWQIMDAKEGAMNLDGNDFKYYGALTMMASKLAYQDPEYVASVVKGCWKMNLIGCYTFRNDFQEKARTHAFIFENTCKDPNVIVVAFRGTSPFNSYDWTVDIDFSWYRVEGVGHVHSGFMKALGLQNGIGWPKKLLPPAQVEDFAYYALREKLREIAKTNDKAKFIITGHSLGGALATLFVTILAKHQESTILNKIDAVYTYGQPRLGDTLFAKFMVKTLRIYEFKYYRYVYSFDLIPRVPFDSTVFNYKHFGGCVYFDCFYNGKFLKGLPATNYFSLIWVIPKYFCAWWEIIRSLITIPITKGRDHFEGIATTTLRMLGLLIPGVSAHISPNYVNLVRWGKLEVLPDQKATPAFACCIEEDCRPASYIE